MADLPLLKMLYPVAHPDRKRIKPMRVLALGLPRSGTDSLRSALCTLGYDHVYHGFDHVEDMAQGQIWVELWHRKETGHALSAADFDRVLGHCEAVTDMPACNFAPDLIRAFPDAKIIINKRADKDAWIRSIVSAFDAGKRETGVFWQILCLFHARMFWLQRVDRRITMPHMFRGDYHRYAGDVYTDHYALLDKIAPADRTLKWDVHEGWDPLCEFLGKDVPEEPFPHKNAIADFAERVKRVATRHAHEAFFNMLMLTGALTVSLSTFVAWRWSTRSDNSS